MTLSREEKKEIKKMKKDPSMGPMYSSVFTMGRLAGMSAEEVYRECKISEAEHESVTASGKRKK